MRIFVDTNIIISAGLFPESIVAKVFQHIITNHKIILCKQTIEEVKSVCKRKFPGRIKIVNAFLNSLEYELIDFHNFDKTKYPEIRDDCDIPILASAIESNADILISGDKDFEEVKIKKPKIINLKKYIEEYMP
ncbi:putative toxin-antitoxin system toxin component, PIN family [Breznakiella homolactica]|uniref:Putative toxin-antitoxin system toxin component, PIN family n=1 Tax=Breznakiella homolactica TaxID=2798577 RepID=A0A7T7XQ25_9SPIR|nr:putative toxin-antitoxin system toxin component, PIN family [Breznakiella homolactica]QQO10392.1 putative toxin-antitoxin system toxin component, PIN family [Breznakiella homolactica]